ncbi:alpha/beta-hydrolase [Schizopora paradoxa]|uniref:Alpha/beta-hydrolase n=1 Tax=Schizopora paradoxa TaxID=27342 RepID=A0A0H2RMG9_9AGAM|nr:alpha/beta-hydrolase [Schizopora paradoxa]
MATDGIRVEATTSTLPPAREIPGSFVSSVKSWWAAGEKDSAAAEERLFRALPFFQSSTWPRQSNVQPITATSSRVTLSTPKRYINTFSITHNNPAHKPPTANTSPVVVLHGYGAGLGFFFRNFGTLGNWVSRTGMPVYALDWLGMGRSARVPFVVKAKRHDYENRVHEAESFFVDSLEEWRVKMGLEKMTLVGHSLGAYLSVVYALRYPSRVSKLVLLSPAGMLGDPNSTTSPARELTDDQQELESPSHSTAGGKKTSSERAKDVRDEQKKEKEKESRTRKVFTYLWEEGVSPFSIVRGLGVFGPMLVGRYASRRFSGISDEETRNMNDYILNITLAKGSGEYCISHILAPFAVARMPLVDRIHEVKVPVAFVYGEHDWMDPLGGLQSIERLKAAGNDNARIYVVDKAGHHVYLDNSEAVNDTLMKELYTDF